MDAEEYELIEKYINRELSHEEQLSFEGRMQQDTQFAAFVNSYIEINKSLQAASDKKISEEQLRTTIQKVSSDYFTQSSKVVSMTNIYWAAAASILLIISFIFILNQPETPTYEAFADHQPLVLATRGTDQTLKHTAVNTFNSAQYGKATDALEQLLKREPDNVNIKIYLAIALLETGKYPRSEQLLQDIERGTSIYTSQASWYLALSYLKQNKLEDCKQQLEKITEGSEKYTQAQELLESL